MAIVLNGTNGIVSPAVQTPTFDSTNALGIRNRIINGAMAIDQRNNGSSQTITAGAALAYTVDRWYAYCTGANVTGQRVTGTGNNQYAYQFTGASSVTTIGFGQRIEAINCFDRAGTTATLSVDLSNSLLTTVTWTAYYANTADTFGTLASPTKTQIATGTFTVNSTLTRYNTQISIPAAAKTGIEIVFTVGAQTSGTWIIDNVQFEAGTVATPFERRFIQQDLMWSQRYYFRLTPGTNNRFGTGMARSTTVSQILVPFPVTMRVAPTALEHTGTAGDYYIAYANSAQVSSAVPVYNGASTSLGDVGFTGPSGPSAGMGVIASAINNTAYLGWSAEL